MTQRFTSFLAGLLLVALSLPATAWAEEESVIELTFAGRGESSNVESVTVTNLSHPEIAPVTLSGTDILCLADEETITPIESVQESKGISQPILTPNPSLGTDGTLIFDAKSDGPVRVGVYSQSGMLMESAVLNVSKGRNTARIPSQGTGIYIINVEGQGVKSSTRWICNGSKSFSGIALGGANQWADITLPVKFPTPARKQSRANAANVVYMEFNEGDILRFEGKSGQMRTIMHISPESSHDVTFDFFRCQDKDGYNYPIVRIGDLLWMLEDLRPLSMSNLIKTSSANIWKNLDDMAAAEFVSGDKAYYTVSGARLAMPEGWEMPSIDEIYALVKDLGSDSLSLGDFMKNRDTEWPMPLIEGPDTLHMQLMANGFINKDGELTGDEVTGAWPTRTTINHGCPATFEISAFNSRFRPLIVHDKRCAFTVRGCRPAPSVYQEMLLQAFQTNAEPSSSRRKLPMQLVNTNGPLGSYYTYGSDRNSVFLDYSSIQLNTSNKEQRSGVLYKTNDNSKWKFCSKNLVPVDVNGINCINHLRKVTSQSNADGYENVVYATWSRPFKLHFNGDKVWGDGVVNITVFGDSTKNHAILDGYATRPLLDANGNEYMWSMPHCNDSGYSIADNGDRQLYWIEVPCEYYARAFNLNSIQDQNGDGVDEIVMNVGNKIAIFDGVSFRCIRERTFDDGGSDLGTPNLRYDVADVNGDGLDDIVLLLNKSMELGYLYVYSEGHIDQEPIFTKTLGASCFFCDVKVGYMTGNNLPEIAMLTRGKVSNTKLVKTGYLYMSRLEYDENMNLKEIVVLPRTSVDCFATKDQWCSRVGNMNLVFGYFRGRSYNQDLVVGDGLWRWDDSPEVQKPTYRFQIMPNVKTTNSIPADAITSVQGRENANECLIYIWNIPMTVSSSSSTESAYHTLSEFCEVWLTENGNKVNTTTSFGVDQFGWGNVGDCFNGWKNTELTRWYHFKSSNEFISHPVLCRFADRERAKHFRFISHEVTFSEPRIHAAIAAAPYYADLETSGSPSTTWGKEMSSGAGSSESDTWGGSLIMGYEHSYSAPFLSSMKAGVEFTAKISAGATRTTGTEQTISTGSTYTAGKTHVVVMQASPYDTYTYEIIASDEPDDIGMNFVVSIPRDRRFVNLTLEDYIRFTADQKGVAKPQKYLTATPGVPSSYPPNYNDVPMLIDSKHPFLQGRDPNSGNSYQNVGTGESSSRSITLANSTTSTTSVEIGVETELVGTVMGVKAGVGFNYNHTNENTHTIGQQLTVEGTVPGLPSLNDSAHPGFNWNIVWYYVNDEGNVYPVVNYAVVKQ